ncbi:cell number regulator 6-like [Solanum stenotomum]|uniref:cell number regulator 6-like n=1 Tax=Solanum stenotomum TaxID=172797 RepID=UPI0020D172F7|nr:cell number regulator 6-like [Solanum stenotomum]
MATGTYVRLTKDQESSLKNITPGELNQPIDVQKQSCAKCEHCGQNLPPSYEPPADEDWATGIFGCTEDVDSCLVGLFCPCVLFGRHMESLNDEISSRGACVGHLVCIEGGIALAALTAAFHGIDPDTACLITEGLLFSWWVCGIYTGMARQMLQRKYHLKDLPCDPCMVHCCLHWCAMCQEHREMKLHLSCNDNPTTTLVDPPPLQEMTTTTQNNDDQVVADSSGKEIVPYEDLEIESP